MKSASFKGFTRAAWDRFQLQIEVPNTNLAVAGVEEMAPMPVNRAFPSMRPLPGGDTHQDNLEKHQAQPEIVTDTPYGMAIVY